jgi:hypothetical protein
MFSRRPIARRHPSLFDALEPRQLMATFMVTTAADTGTGSLRWAIAQANATPAMDNIGFAIGSGPATINIASTLTINQPVVIDATTQPGYTSSPIVRIMNSGSSIGGLDVSGAGSVIRGLSITNMGTAALPGDGTGVVVAKQNITIEKCYIGIAPSGSGAGNEGAGVFIGGNLGDGITVYASNVTIQSNKIGTDPTGFSPRNNAGNGVHNTGVTGLLVGGDLPAQGNLISASGNVGVLFANLNARGSVFNNFIGTTISGNGKLANATAAVQIHAANDVVIGDFNKGNRIGGNGILVTGNGKFNKIHSNIVGVGVNPLNDVGDSYGIDVAAAYDCDVEHNTVGYTLTGIKVAGNNHRLYANNVGITDAGNSVPNTTGIAVNGQWNRLLANDVANNSSYGVHVQSGKNNSVDNNRIWGSGQSLKLNPGTNDSLTVPQVDEAYQDTSSGQWTVKAFMDVPLGSTYTLSFYLSDFAGNAASGHMQQWLGSVTLVGTAALEPVTRTFSPDKLQDGRFITVTLTQTYVNNGQAAYGSTSQPSSARELVGLPSVYDRKFEYATGHAWSYTFSDNISASLAAGDLALSRSDGTIYSANSVTWNAATKTARFVRNTPLPDGQYTAGIKTTAVSNGVGANVENFPLKFVVLRGDANGDGVVNFSDLLVFAQNYNTTGKNFTQGDFNYDGQVNFNDLLILAQNYGQQLALPAAAPAAKRPAEQLLA